MKLTALCLVLFCAGALCITHDTVLVALKQRNIEQLETLVASHLSNPQSPLYGHYLSPEQLADQIGLPEKDIATVIEFLKAHNGQRIETMTTRDFIKLTLPTHVAKDFEQKVPKEIGEYVKFFVRLTKKDSLRIVEADQFVDVQSSIVAAPVVFASQSVDTEHLNIWVVPKEADIDSIALRLEETNSGLVFDSTLSARSRFTCMPCGSLLVTPHISSFQHTKFCGMFKQNQDVCFIENLDAPQEFGLTDEEAMNLIWSVSASVILADGRSSDFGSSDSSFRLVGKEWDPNSQKGVYQLSKNLISSSSATQVVWGTGSYGYSSSDLSKFYNDYDIPTTTSYVEPLGEAGDPKGDNYVEATLDIQYLSAMAPQMNSACINTDNSTDAEGGAGFGPAMLDFATQINNLQNPPNVISLSLGSLSWASCNLMCTQAQALGAGSYSTCMNYVQSQFQVCMYTSADQVSSISTEFMKMGARGVSVFAATGDGGNHFSFGAFKPFGPNAHLARTLNEISCNYTLPTFPAASPWVTGVGAAQMMQQNNGSYYPIGCSTQTGGGITGGAAFSWQFPMPSYQQSVVQSYLSAHSGTNFGNFNASGRAYPDLTGIGSSVPIVVNGAKTVVGGTSCSAPEVAGVFSMINDWRVGRGLPAVGFVNTRLYQAAATSAPSMFVDITEGNSSCGIGKCCPTGFVAAPGWDAFTGFGNILYPGLLQAFST